MIAAVSGSGCRGRFPEKSDRCQERNGKEYQADHLGCRENSSDAAFGVAAQEFAEETDNRVTAQINGNNPFFLTDFHYQ